MNIGNIIDLVIPNSKFCHHPSKVVLQKQNCFHAQDHCFLGQASKITALFVSLVGFFFFATSFQNSHTMDGFVDVSDVLSGLVNFHDSSAELN